MSDNNREQYIEEQINLINKAESDKDSFHYNIVIQNEGDFYFQKVDSELNRDSIIFTTALAKLSGLNTVVYYKYTASNGDLFVFSQKFDEGKSGVLAMSCLSPIILKILKESFLKETRSMEIRCLINIAK